MTSQVTPQEQDYPLSPVPMDQRRSIWSMGLVLLGFTFFTATMWAGGSIGVAFDFSTMLLVLAGTAQRIAPWLGRNGRWFNRVTGAAFVGIGGVLATTSRG